MALGILVAGLIDRYTECLIAHTLCSESAIAREATVFILTMRYMRFPHTNVQRTAGGKEVYGSGKIQFLECGF